MRSRDNQTQFGGYDDGRHRLFVTCKSGTWRWCFTLTDDCLCPCVPMPEEDSTVSTSGCDVTVRSNIALAARQASDNSVMTEHYLNDFCCK